ncbi:MAG TPA: cation diffusion facilitator family transporter [Thermodesulfobacteriota bacterium]|nr:cation diffusion facilitator family transporter [Thermodesulfobacteriota bacterium]
MNSKEKHTHHHDLDSTLKSRLVLSIALTAVIFITELVGGYLTNSLALMSDAAHVFMDVFALSLSWFAIYISEMPPSETRTWGLHRVEVFVSFINSLVLFVLTLFIFYEAYHRFLSPEPVKSAGMMVVAVVGLVVNLVVALWLRHYAGSDLNVRSAFIHVIGDAAASVGVIIGAIVIYYTGWFTADPLISVLIGMIIIYGAYGIIKESSHILLEGVPKDIDFNKVMEDIKSANGISSVHSLHIWSICHNVYALSAHLDIIPTQRWRMGEIFDEINEKLADNYHIFYTTLQAECSGCDTADVFGRVAHKERNHNHGHNH